MAETLRKKNKGPDFRVYVGTSFPNPIFCEIESLAKQHELAAAQVVRELFMRGLAAYQRDGNLSEVAATAESLTIAAQEIAA
ncbi:MAG: hypothetical protein DMF72_19985 [Acidobacteria bacterium]|nr:MAG: hypothetical protein DMF72_19985 [Acidobacteriota bacterium]